MPKREGGTIHHVLARDAATLVYLAGQNAIALHVWPSRSDRLERPDRLVFDLDPATERFAEVRAAAREAGRPAARRGAHAVRDDHRLARAARGRPATPDGRLRCGPRLCARGGGGARGAGPGAPHRRVPARRRRGERIFVDVGRNAYGQHSDRALFGPCAAGAPVATPAALGASSAIAGSIHRAGRSPPSASGWPKPATRGAGWPGTPAGLGPARRAAERVYAWIRPRRMA